MKIKVIYLARLSEDIGINEEYIEISEPETTIKDIYLKLNLDKFNLGLLLKGSHEIRPGYKDYDLISDYLEAIDESF